MIQLAGHASPSDAVCGADHHRPAVAANTVLPEMTTSDRSSPATATKRRMIGHQDGYDRHHLERDAAGVGGGGATAERRRDYHRPYDRE